MNGSADNSYTDKMNRPKRYSSNRNQGDYNAQNDWGDKSGESRNYRMGSEPRGTYCNKTFKFQVYE